MTSRPARKAQDKTRSPARLRTYTGNTTVAKIAQGDPWKPLTEQQKKFVKAYASGENMTNSLALAGFASGNVAYGYRLLAAPNVAKSLKEAQITYAKVSELSKKDVIDMHKEAYDMAKLMSEPSSMVAAAREIGKMCGYYEPTKVEMTLQNGQRKKIEQLSDEELFAMIQEATAEATLAIEHEDGSASA